MYLKAILISSLLLLSACATRMTRHETSSKQNSYTKPQTMIEVEAGRRLNLYCVGSGSPVVMLESGLTDPINVWSLVQPSLASQTQVCAYDRAGVGFSDAQSRASNSENIANDLHILLKKAGLKPPFLLVGHSAGGMHARMYAYVYPKEVIGLVLVDPSHEDQTEGFRKLDPKKRTIAEWDQQVLQPSLELRKGCIEAANPEIVYGSESYEKCSFPQYAQLDSETQEATREFQMSKKFQRAQLSEEETIFHESSAQLRSARKSLGSLPITVLTKDRPPMPTQTLTEAELEHRDARYSLWVSLGKNSAADSTRGRQIIVPGASHNMPLESPGAIIDAVASQLAEYRKTEE